VKKAIVLVCLAVLVAGVGAAVGCGGGGDSGKTPSQVADEYMRASVDMDVEAAYELLSEADRKNITKEQMEEMSGEAAMESYDVEYVIGEETIDGDSATVEVTISVTDKASGESEEFTDKLSLVKESSGWKIYFGDSL